MMTKNVIPTETERKFLIKKPVDGELTALSGCVKSEITQTYLVNSEAAERVRKRVYEDKTVYTHTTKKRISPLSSLEDESEISEEEYTALLARADKDKNPIRKIRYAIPYSGHTFEIDVYPFWNKQAVMEVELESEDERAALPPFAAVIREVTGDHAYSNNTLSRVIPPEDD